MSITGIGAGLAQLLPNASPTTPGQAGTRPAHQERPHGHHGGGKPPESSTTSSLTTAGEPSTILDQLV